MDYETMVEAQIQQYREVKNIHDLPDIFHYWSNRYLRPRLNAVHGVDSVVDFYAQNFLKTAEKAKGAQFASIGSGDSTLELSIINRLVDLGANDFNIDCFELSPHLIAMGKEASSSLGLTQYIKFFEIDINKNLPLRPKGYNAIMAHHSLHHFINLESIFNTILNALVPDGVFVTNDMIGRNGHLRWPETLEYVEKIWAFLPDRFKYNRQMKRLEKSFINHDCSLEGFEGIRAQDILPLLIQTFKFSSFLAYGGLIEVFTDRGFGHNFAPNDSNDLMFIDFVNLLNDALIENSAIKPTMMYAVMTATNTPCTQWRHWTPEFCIRPTSPTTSPTTPQEGFFSRLIRYSRRNGGSES